MSDATEKPVDADAWETACAEDLAEEKARRRAQHGPPPGSAAEELKKLVDAVTDKIAGLSGGQAPFLGAVAQGTAEQAAKQVVRQVRNVVEPVIERNSDVFDHLAAAGSELLAAYRSAVEGQERRWTQRTQDPAPPKPRKGEDEGPGGEHIDLD
ncbi:DUF5304 domain-containing protein [Streptomyces sp. VRA16 Mangrove soil]|uniref:DUF5304 domain-containing protein n=1 Tax=Streptomyces sp. VRA16 Mangrove soil TaxID=2817434 RepID=UPI001A9D1B7B|nr:DUF5304 domain-containing protein [Streptomyces sp. VRA16 Mangrove soil]MBO1333362.1 DUF5304 domain-containing protein [Streptomyces sp. VRA16 Mangrove soil]